jgi:siroheme synthase-like protein
VERGYQFGDLSGFLLAFAATGNLAVDAAVFAEGKTAGVLVNSADDPIRCDFFLPAVVRRGDLAVAVSTGGASPALARAVREELQEVVGEEYATLVEITAATRIEVLRSSATVTGDRWTMALKEPKFRRLVREGQKPEAMARLRALLGMQEKNDAEW